MKPNGAIIVVDFRPERSSKTAETIRSTRREGNRCIQETADIEQGEERREVEGSIKPNTLQESGNKGSMARNTFNSESRRQFGSHPNRRESRGPEKKSSGRWMFCLRKTMLAVELMALVWFNPATMFVGIPRRQQTARSDLAEKTAKLNQLNRT